ncbi:MAG: hypothetical protein WAO41_00485 [Candidatus Nanopelagicales bacterium]
MTGDVLIDVAPQSLPPTLQLRLLGGGSEGTQDRFRPQPLPSARTPMLWMLLCAMSGLALLAIALPLPSNPVGDFERFLAAIFAAICAVFTLYAGLHLRSAVTERRDARAGKYRLGAHILGREGLLIAERGRCTWAPRQMLIAPVADPSSDTRSGSGRYLLLISDGRGHIKRVALARSTARDIDHWRRTGTLPMWEGR